MGSRLKRFLHVVRSRLQAGRQVGRAGGNIWLSCWRCGLHYLPQRTLQAPAGPELGPLPQQSCTCHRATSATHRAPSPELVVGREAGGVRRLRGGAIGRVLLRPGRAAAGAGVTAGSLRAQQRAVAAAAAAGQAWGHPRAGMAACARGTTVAWTSPSKTLAQRDEPAPEMPPHLQSVHPLALLVGVVHEIHDAGAAEAATDARECAMLVLHALAHAQAATGVGVRRRCSGLDSVARERQGPLVCHFGSVSCVTRSQNLFSGPDPA